MSIEFTRAYRTSDGNTHPTLEEAQKVELKILAAANYQQSMTVSDWLDLLVDHRGEVLAILSQKERQRVRASKPASRGVAKRRNGRASNLGTELPLAKEPATTPQPQ